MTRRILLTSFSTWKVHQKNNSSDQLLVEISSIPSLASSLHFFRYLPVNLPVARSLTISKFQQVQPDVLVCCGMAEARSWLSVEAQATVHTRTLQTSLNLTQLTAGLKHTVLSQDAGRFVCNSLYYAMLDYLHRASPQCPCLFVHVPPVKSTGWELIVADFRQLIERLLGMESLCQGTACGILDP